MLKFRVLLVSGLNLDRGTDKIYYFTSLSKV